MRKILTGIVLSLMFASTALAATTYTTHYNLAKPSDGSTSWGSSIRDNFDTIDTQLFSSANSITNHVSDTVGAHAATAISTTVGSTACTTSDDVQQYLDCLDAQIGGIMGGGVVLLTTDQVIGGNKDFTGTTSFFGPTILDGDVSFTNLTDGLLHINTNIVTSSKVINNDIDTFAAISYSKLNLATSIVNADVNASAAIAYSKLAPLTSANILVGSGSNVATVTAITGDISINNTGVTAYSGTVPLNKGGTGQTTKAAAFDALSPMTAGGDIIYGGASGTGTRLANGSAGQVLTSAGGTSAPTWSATNLNLSVSAVKASTYAILTTDDVVLVDGTSAFTATLPTAVGVTGKQYKIKRVDQTLANAVTIATTSSQTIDGATTRRLMTQFEEFTVVSDNANWRVISHTYPQGWTSYTPTSSTWSANQTLTGFWRRLGDSAQFQTKTALTGAPTNANYAISIPANLTIDTAKMPGAVQFFTSIPGATASGNRGGSGYPFYVAYYSTTEINVSAINAAGTYAAGTQLSTTVPATWANGDYITSAFTVPITNWEP